VSYAHAIVENYFRRRNVPPDGGLDGLYRFEMTVLRSTLDLLEVILDDEGVDRETAQRVIRCMLYGSPSPAAAEERMRRDAEIVKMPEHQARPSVPPEVAAALAGLPPEVYTG
jgi:hypothetical protein